MLRELHGIVRERSGRHGHALHLLQATQLILLLGHLRHEGLHLLLV